MIELELMKAGTDSQGDTFTKKSIEAVVADFVPGSVPVTIGFDPRAVPVGKVQALRLDGDRVMATVELDDDGKAALAKGLELASGGQCTLKPGEKPGFGSRTRTIEGFKLTDAALTDNKVK